MAVLDSKRPRHPNSIKVVSLTGNYRGLGFQDYFTTTVEGDVVARMRIVNDDDEFYC